MYCTTCGNEIPDDSKFCTHCGASVDYTPEPGNQPLPLQPDSTAEKSESARVNPVPFQTDQTKTTKKMSPAAKAGTAVAAVGLAAGIVFGSYSVYTNFAAPTPQPQANEAAAPNEEPANADSNDSATQQTETNLASKCSTKKTYNYIEVPTNPYKSPGQKSKDKWTYDQLTSSNKSDASDQINTLIRNAEDSSAKRSSSFPTSASARSQVESEDKSCTLGRDISVTYLKGNVVGVYDSRLISDWKSQDRPVLLGAAFDLSSGEPVDPASVYNLTIDETVSSAKTAVKTYLSKHPSDTKTTEVACSKIESNIKGDVTSGLQDNLEGSSPLVLTDRGLVYMTSIYELGSWSYGCHGIIIASDNKSLVGTEVDLSTIHKIDQ